MTPLSSSNESVDSLFKSEENPYYKNLVSKLLDNEEDSSSSSEPVDFIPYVEFWNRPAPKSEEKDK